MNRCRKKVIPWHVQQRYMESFSLLSLNQSISAAMYKKKIKSLQRNNKHLALALQQSRHLVTDKENLRIENGNILKIMNFSRVKLMDMAMNMKQATECLDETLLMLNSSLTDSLSNRLPRSQDYRSDFKNKLRKCEDISEITDRRNSTIKEVSENSDSSNQNVESHARKGKISRVDGCVSSPNKKCKLTNKGRTVKINCKDHPKSAKGSSSTVPTTGSKNTTVKNAKCGSGFKSKSNKKTSPKNSNIESTSSSKSPVSSSNHFLQTKIKQESLNKKRKAVKVILTDIAEAFVSQEAENYHSPVTNGSTSASSSTNFKCLTQNSPEDDILIQKYFSSVLSCKQRSSASVSYGSQFAAVNDVGVPNHSLNTSNSSDSSHKNLSSSDILEVDKIPVLSSVENEDFGFGPTSAVMEMEQIGEDDIAKQNNGSYVKKTDSEKDKRSYKSHNSKVTNRVHFYFDEDAIEKVEGNSVTSKDKIRKSFNKCKARKTVSHKKKNIPSESTSLKTNLILSDNISKLGKNSFLVTAEVHSPPNGVYVKKINSKICVSEKMEPCVVLTDIFKSNRGLLSEMVGNGSHENGCLQETVTKPAIAAPLAEMNTINVNKKPTYNVNAASMDCENDSENRCLPEDREIIEQGKQRRRSKIVSYKEPSLHVKMRRLF